MEIDLQTKISALLDAYPGLEETLMELSPAFAKLRNPVLRRTIGRVATIQQAAAIAGIPPGAMVQALRKAAGLRVAEDADYATETAEDEGRPEWFDGSLVSVRFDAGAVIDAGGSPMAEIIRLAEELDKGHILEISVPFQPEPIMDILRSRGFGVWYCDGRCYVLKP